MAQIKGGGAGGKGAAAGGSKGAAVPNAGKMEKAFGQGFDDIKAHGTQHAEHGKLDAKAFTGGNTAHFGAGAPDSAAGALGHEAAHVVQQRAGVQL